MSLLVVGVNHRSAPLPMLERVTISADDLGKAVAGLAVRDTVRESVVLSTCNRTEVYVVTEVFHGAFADVRDVLCEAGDLSVEELTPFLYAHYEQQAIEHLFEVAAGLDSAVLGETEVLGQIRAAWELAQRHGGAKASLNPLFRASLEVGKRVRTETDISRGTASVSHAAVEMIAEMLPGDERPLAGRSLLVIGAGSMGEGVTRALRKAGGADITVANRSAERGSALADRFGGTAIGFDELETAVRRADVIVAGTGSDLPVLTLELIERARAGRPDPLHIVDIAVPRDVAPEVANLPGVVVFDLDDLRDWADRGLGARAAAAERARRIVADEVERFLVDSVARQAAPLVASMHAAAEAVRVAELDRFGAKLASLDDRQRRAVEALTRSIVAKLLHEPSVRLKSQAGTPQGERNAAAVRDLFDLP